MAAANERVLVFLETTSGREDNIIIIMTSRIYLARRDSIIFLILFYFLLEILHLMHFTSTQQQNRFIGILIYVHVPPRARLTGQSDDVERRYCCWAMGDDDVGRLRKMLVMRLI